MSLPTTAAEICTLAMDALTAANVALIAPATTPIETICARHYDLSRRSLYEAFHYNFAEDYATLSPSADAPKDDWAYKFLIPTDCIELLAIENRDLPLTQYPYSLRGRHIYANYDGNLPVYYTRDVTNPSEMSASFIYYLAYELAMNTAKACGAKDERLVKLANIREEKRRAAQCNATKSRPGKVTFGSRMFGAAQTYTGPTSGIGATGLFRQVM